MQENKLGNNLAGLTLVLFTFLFGGQNLTQYLNDPKSFEDALPWLGGAASVTVIDAFNKTFKIEDENWRFISSFVLLVLFSLFLAIPKLLTTGTTDLRTNFFIVFGMSQIVFKLFWRNTGTRMKYMTPTDTVPQPVKQVAPLVQPPTVQNTDYAPLFTPPTTQATSGSNNL